MKAFEKDERVKVIGGAWTSIIGKLATVLRDDGKVANIKVDGEQGEHSLASTDLAPTGKLSLTSTGQPVYTLSLEADPIIDVKMPPRRTMNKTIVKVQLPIVQSTDEENPPRALVYSEDHTIMFEAVLTPALKGRFRDHEMKLYFHAEIDVDNREIVEIGDRAPVQSW